MASDSIEKKRKYAREWMAKKRLLNREECNRKSRIYQKQRRASGNDKWYNFFLNNIEQKRIRREKSRKNWEENRDQIKSKERSDTKELTKSYVIRQLRKDGIGKDIANRFPILIEAKKETLKLKRLIYAR